LAADAPGVNPLVASSPTVIREFVSAEQLPGVLWAYDQALKWTYFTIIPVGESSSLFTPSLTVITDGNTAAMSIIAALFIKNKALAMPGAKPPGQNAKKDAVAEDSEKMSAEA
jgi:hypothetical protein